MLVQVRRQWHQHVQAALLCWMQVLVATDSCSSVTANSLIVFTISIYCLSIWKTQLYTLVATYSNTSITVNTKRTSVQCIPPPSTATYSYIFSLRFTIYKKQFGMYHCMQQRPRHNWSKCWKHLKCGCDGGCWNSIGQRRWQSFVLCVLSVMKVSRSLHLWLVLPLAWLLAVIQRRAKSSTIESLQIFW